MRKIVLSCAALLFIALAAGATLAQQTAPPAKPYTPGLGEFMLSAQARHAKLWLAGSVQNWDLADYSIDELKEGLENAVKYIPTFKDIPIGQMIESTAMAPIAEVESAIKAKDRAKFVTAFDKLTAACNTCHQAANRGFIVVQRPTTSPFPNQSFTPVDDAVRPR
jgi:hypothetical protein